MTSTRIPHNDTLTIDTNNSLMQKDLGYRSKCSAGCWLLTCLSFLHSLALRMMHASIIILCTCCSLVVSATRCPPSVDCRMLPLRSLNSVPSSKPAMPHITSLPLLSHRALVNVAPGQVTGASPLGQVAERNGSPMQEITIEPSCHTLKALIFPVSPPAPPSALLAVHYIYIPKLIECSFFWKHSTVSTCPVCSQNNYEK